MNQETLNIIIPVYLVAGLIVAIVSTITDKYYRSVEMVIFAFALWPVVLLIIAFTGVVRLFTWMRQRRK